MKARELLNPMVCWVHMADEAGWAAVELRRSGAAAAAVLNDDDRLVGLLSAGDLPFVDWAGPSHTTRPSRRRMRVGEVMRTPVVSLTPGALLVDVQEHLDRTSDPCVLVVDGLRVLGTIDRTDLALLRLRSGMSAVVGVSR